MEDFKICDIKISLPSEVGTKSCRDSDVPGTHDVADLIAKLNECFKNEQQNFCYICYYLNELKKRFDSFDLSYYHRYFDKTSKFVFYETVLKAFGLEEKQVQRYIKVYFKFMILTDDVVPKLKDAFFGYSKSKLIELLPLSDSQIEKAFNDKRITVDSTVKDIRNYVKSLNGGSKKDNKVLEESGEEIEVSDCGQYIKFSSENFDYIKKVIKGKKYNYTDTSSFLNALLKYAREKELFL